MIENKIAKILAKENLIVYEDIDIYAYGIEVLILKIVHTMTILCIGLITNIPFQVVLFLILFSLYRSVSPGFHAKTKIRCFAMSIVITLFLILLNKIDVISICSIIVTLIIYLISSIIFLYTTHTNIHAVKAKYAWITTSILLSICWLFDYYTLCITITYALFATIILTMLKNVK